VPETKATKKGKKEQKDVWQKLATKLKQFTEKLG